MPSHTTSTAEEWLIDCSLHHGIINKPAVFASQYARGWKQRTLNLAELRAHISKGLAFIPAAMSSDHRRSDAFLHADLAVIDIDHGMTVEQFCNHPLAIHCAWLYTTCSHDPANNKHRLRAIFRLPERISNPERYRSLISALTAELGGDKSCTDPCRLFYGNDRASHPLLQDENILPMEILEALIELHATPAVSRSRKATAEACDAHTVELATYVLEHVLRPTDDGERDRFIKITAAAASGGEALFTAWQSWANRCHHTSGHRSKQSSERYFLSFYKTRSTLSSLFYVASEDDPDWRDNLPEGLHQSFSPTAGMPGVAGYSHEDFLGDPDDMGWDEYDSAWLRQASRSTNATPSLFDPERPWAAMPTETSPAPATTAVEEKDIQASPSNACDDDYDPEPPDDWDDDDPYPDPPTRHQNQRHQPRAGDQEVRVIHGLLKKHYPNVRLNLLSQRYEYTVNGAVTEIEDITTAYIQISPDLDKIPPKTAVTDCLRFMARHNAYHPVKEYLERCNREAKPWPHFERIASEILGMPADEIKNPTLANGQCLGDAVLQRFLIAAVARVFEPGCTMQWMPILVGSQGIGKSRFIELLTPLPTPNSQRHSWTSFNQYPLRNLSEKPHLLHSGWIVVLDEIDRHFKRDQVEIFKNLVSISTDRSARKYENELDYPRSFVLIGSTNSETFFKDPTGNRRFLPIYVCGRPRSDSPEQQQAVDLSTLERHRDAIWAAAVHAYQTGKAQGIQGWHFNSHELAALKPYMDGFYADNPFASTLAHASPATFCKKLNRPVPMHGGEYYVHLHDIYDYLDISIDRHSSVTIPVSDALRMLGFKDKRIKTEAKRIRVWFFPDAQQGKDDWKGNVIQMPDTWGPSNAGFSSGSC